jgi:hypothetical protein
LSLATRLWQFMQVRDGGSDAEGPRFWDSKDALGSQATTRGATLHSDRRSGVLGSLRSGATLGRGIVAGLEEKEREVHERNRIRDGC